MPSSRVAVRYARACYASADEAKAREAVRDDLLQLKELAATSPEFAAFLAAPLVPTGRQQEVLGRVAEGCHELTGRFLRFLAAKDRLDQLPDIVVAYEKLYRQAEGIQAVTVTSAVALSALQQKALSDRLTTKLRATIELTTAVDPSLIGGFRLQVGDEIHDYSLASRLADFEHKALNA